MYFAKHAVFPGVKGNLTAPGTSWILYGGSLAGAETAFSVKQYGDTLYGGIAASGVIHAVLGYPEVRCTEMIFLIGTDICPSGTIRSKSSHPKIAWEASTPLSTNSTLSW